MHEKKVVRWQVGSRQMYMKTVSSFMPNYLQTSSFFIHGESYDKKKSMISGSLQVNQVKCEFSYRFILSAYRTFCQTF